MIEKTKPEPKVRSIAEIAGAAVKYFNAISGNAIGNGKIGYIDSRKWKPEAKDGFLGFYDRETVSVSGSVESADSERDRMYAVLRPVVYYYRDMTEKISKATPDEGEAFTRSIANSCASVFCAAAMSMLLTRDDGVLKGSVEANVVMELLKDLRGLGPQSFSMESVKDNADSGFVKSNMDSGADGKYGALLLLAHNSFDYVKTMKDMLDMTDEELSSAIFEEAVLDRHAMRFVGAAMKVSENGISFEGIEDIISRHIGGEDIGKMPMPAMGDKGKKKYFAEKDLETGVKLTESRINEDGSGMYALRIPVDEKHIEDVIRAIIIVGVERHERTGMTELEGMKVGVLRRADRSFVVLQIGYAAGDKERAETAVNRSAQAARTMIAQLEEEGRK